MIQIELDIDDLVALVKGRFPSYSLMQNMLDYPDDSTYKLLNSIGSYSGSYDTWNWNSRIYDLNEDQLMKLHFLLKDSQ